MKEKRKYIIEYNGQHFNASEYQNKIFNSIEHGTGNLVINAAAGSAKTTTIVNSIKYIPENKKILFVAFNRDIVKKIKENVNHSNTTILTFHSLGYYILLENNIINKYRTDNNFIDENKYKNYIRNNLNILLSETDKGIYKNKNKYSQFISNIFKLVDYSRYYLAFTIKEIENVAKLYGVILIGNECDICRKILLWGKQELSIIDYTDLLWLPNVLNLTSKKYAFNWIFVDEAQDTNIAEQELIKKCFKRGTRFAIVCDNFQQINVWAGSTIQAIENFRKFPNTKDYNLPISYRCPKKVIELAKEYSDNIIADENAIDGEINYDVLYTKPIDGDMVLCRMTAPLISLYLKYLKLNKKAYVRGFENIKDDYLNLIKDCKSNLLDKECLTSNGLFPTLYKRLIENINSIREKYNLSLDETLENTTILTQYDNIEALRVLSQGLVTTEELCNRIKTIFNNSNEGIVLSTIHKAKGLESDNIFILLPSLLKSKKTQKDWEKQIEENLIYVAYTRAKKTLNFIKEDNKKFLNAESNNKIIKKEIEDISEKIKFNIDNNIIESGITQYFSTKIKNVEITENNTKTKKKNPLSKLKIF